MDDKTDWHILDRLAFFIENTSGDPCDDCHNRELCKNEYLACYDFAKFCSASENLQSFKHEAPRLALRSIYNQVFFAPRPFAKRIASLDG